MSVRENLELGAYGSKTHGVELEERAARVYRLFPRLKERFAQMAGTLSGGEQQMLAMGRALMASPTVLLLDEPSMGLAPNLVSTVFDLIGKIREETGAAVLLVEQNAFMALRIADFAYVLENGSIVLEGLGSNLLQDSRVRGAYLGIKAQH
jgi:branched-chain amino acid transport system ATP-binding protein